MSITPITLPSALTPLDFSGERLVRNDTVAMITKENSKQQKLENWSAGLPDLITDWNRAIDEINDFDISKPISPPSGWVAADSPITTPASTAGSWFYAAEEIVVDGVTWPAGTAVVATSDTVAGMPSNWERDAARSAGTVVILASGGVSFFGTRSGVFVDGESTIAMPASGIPDTEFPASDFPAGWRQMFTGGISGSEVWITMDSAVGNNKSWRKIA